MYLRSDAIVIGKRSFKESDRIITFFTRYYGKLDVKVKGIRKIDNRFGSSLEFFTYNQILFWEKKKDSFLTLTQCQTREAFFQIRSNLNKITAAFYIIDLVRELTKEKDKSVDIFNLLLVTLYLLENKDRPETIICCFQLRLLYLLGIGPELNKCINCGSIIIKNTQHFSFSKGGIVCSQCLKYSSSNIRLAVDTLESMKKFLSISIKRTQNIRLSLKILNEIHNLFSRYIYYHFEKKIRSEKVLKELLYNPSRPLATGKKRI